MKKRAVFGAVLIILGLDLAIGPQTIFTPCPLPTEEGVRPMKCHWSAQAELGLGVVIAALGLLSMAFESGEVRGGLYMGAALMGIGAWATVGYTIGVCQGAHMQCRTLMLPMVTIVALAVSAVGAFGAYTSLKRRGR